MASLNKHYRAARPSCDRSSEISVVLGKRIQGCATSNPNLKIIAGPHDGFNSVRAAATRDKKLPFSLARCQPLHQGPTGIRKDRPCRFRCPHCSTRHKILASAAAIVHEQIVGAPARIRNLGFRPFCSSARAETLQHRLLLRSHHVRSYGEETFRSDHPGNGPRTMILRKFAAHQITGEGVQTLLVSDLKM